MNTQPINPVRLTGDALRAAVSAHNAGTESKSDLVRRCGYTETKPDGTERLNFTAFYEALLAAKGIATTAAEDEAEYNAMSSQQQELYDAVHETYGEKWDHAEILGFMECLADYGVEDADTMHDAVQGPYDSWNWQRDFITELLECHEGYSSLTNDAGMLSWVCIDYEATWDTALRYDYGQFDYDGDAWIVRSV